MSAFATSTALGVFTIAPVEPARDAALLHAWLTHPASVFWQMGDLSAGQVRDYLDQVTADAHQDAWLGRLDGEPVLLVETYDPRRVLLPGLFDADPGDLGMHVLLAPRADGTEVRHGLGDAAFAAVMRFCLGDEPGARGATRVVVEPDVRNAAIAAKNAAAGFRVLRRIALEGKQAALSVCTRDDFAASPLGAGAPHAPHLRPELANRAHRHLVAKTIAELAHERLFLPEHADGADSDPAATHEELREYTLAAGKTLYRFWARRHLLEHWTIDEPSLTRTVDGEPASVDALEAITDLQPVLGIPDDLLPVYLEEVSATFAAACAKLEREASGETPSAPQLAALLRDGDPAEAFQAAEAAMSEGHPGFIANNGRIGFSLSDYARYAPERGARTRLMWLAARRAHTHLSLSADQHESGLYDAELTNADRAAFAARLRERGLDPADYLYLPVHPWQWEHRVAITFAADVARGDLVPVGTGGDEYQPQQSIRTFFNRTRTRRHYVKVALAIQNMGFLRGLSPAYMRATPEINDWVAGTVHGDDTLRRAGFGVLRELAAIGYAGDAYHRTPTANPYRKMLAALWRESPLPRLEDGERVVTMAALLHRDAQGVSLTSELIRASGVDPAQWVRGYLDAYLYPVVHCLLAHELAFMPHGENLILVLRDGVVRRAFVKDIGEEVAVVGERPLPTGIERIRAVLPDGERALAVFTDVFDGVLRHLAAILSSDGVLPEAEFWALVGETIARHRDEHPGLVTGVDLTAATFAHSCLNRLQLRNTLQMVDLADQAGSLIYAGEMANPIARVAAAAR